MVQIIDSDLGPPADYIDDDDLTILDYARRHKLSRDHLTRDPLSVCRHLQNCPLSDSGAGQDVNLEDLELEHYLPIAEKWALTPSGARYLFETMRNEQNTVDCEAERATQKIKRNKFTLPLLRTDADIDLHNFCRLAQRHDLNDHLTRSHLAENDKKDESSLYWPLAMNAERLRADTLAANEKMVMTTKTAMYLRSITDATLDTIDVPAEPDRRPFVNPDSNFSPGALSPPLLPLSPESLPQSRTPQFEDIQLTSMPQDPSTLELAGLEEQMFAEDRLDVLDGSHAHDKLVPMCAPSSESSDIRTRIKRLLPVDFKIESPLLALESLSSPFKRTKTIEQALRQIDPGVPSSPPISDKASPDEDYIQFFDDIVELAAPVQQDLANEKLQEADSTMRMTVPDLGHRDDWTPPWLLYSSIRTDEFYIPALELKSQAQMLVRLVDALPAQDHSWKLKNENLLLYWNPTGAQNAEALVPKETIAFGDAISCVQRYVDGVHADLRLSNEMLIWKREGYRILDDSEDDEDDDELVSEYYVATPCGTHESHDEPESWLAASLGHARPGSSEPRNIAAMGSLTACDDTLFSATNALETFMRIQGGFR